MVHLCGGRTPGGERREEVFWGRHVISKPENGRNQTISDSKYTSELFILKMHMMYFCTIHTIKGCSFILFYTI
jgi:hypothetical protein